MHILPPITFNYRKHYYCSLLDGVILERGDYMITIRNTNAVADVKNIKGELIVRYGVRAKY